MNKFPALQTIALLILTVWYSLDFQMPDAQTEQSISPDTFSTARALAHVKMLSTAPHYTGNTTHVAVQEYLISSLKELGLTPTIQKGVIIGKTGSMSHPQNIIARIKGSEDGKALLLMAHYDSNPHSAYGASDDASGVATILESLRAYLHTAPQPKNDIIILFTDGEELGLHGARLFISEHPWAANVGLALNFEARGSGGPSFMLVETTTKNSRLIKEFIKAAVPYPVANSLAYSIYKLMPNDTDLTVFREQGAINGFNFAFIDDHFDYHTANDTWDRLDQTTLTHQGSYLMALLPYFANNALDNFDSDQDLVYFNLPIVHLWSYPFSWRYALIVIALLLFIGVIIYGVQQHRLQLSKMLKGYIPLIGVILISGGATFYGFKLLQFCYPHYAEILQGFPYNGHWYIYSFVFFSLAICSWVYGIKSIQNDAVNLLIAPLSIWLLISILAAIYLPGASYLIIIVYFGLLGTFVRIRQKQPLPSLIVLLGFPALYLIVPFIRDFPIALGLKLVVLSSILTVLLFCVLQPFFHLYYRKKLYTFIFISLGAAFFVKAHLQSNFTEHRQKPNSLVYVADIDQQKAVWASYDKILDSWTEKYFDATTRATKKDSFQFASKYGTTFNFVNDAPYKTILASKIEISEDTIVNSRRKVTLCITPQRTVNRYDLFANKKHNFKKLLANGATAPDFVYQNGNTYNAFSNRWNDRLLTYYVAANTPLELEFHLNIDENPELILYEISYDLLENQQLYVPNRSKHMMPKPFVPNDAVILKRRVNLNILPHEY